MTMYANDNAGYGYIHGGHYGKRREGTWDGETTVSANRIIYPWDPNNQRWFTEGYGSFGPGWIPTNRLISGQPQRWLCTKTEPSRPVGIGLLYAGGYLTSKGAQILFCPSNNSARRAKELRKDRVMRYDADEPFFTSNGKIKRGDDDGIGQRPTNYPAHSCYDGDPANDRSCYSASVDSGICEVLTNYSIRLKFEYAHYWNSHYTYGIIFQTGVKLEEVGSLAVVTDNLDQWLGYTRYHASNECVLPGATATSGNPPDPAYYPQAANYAITNHDASYNVLFTDGSVKTYGDGGKSLFKSLVDLFAWTYWPGDVACIKSVCADNDPQPRMSLDDRIWTPYLDTAYSQD